MAGPIMTKFGIHVYRSWNGSYLKKISPTTTQHFGGLGCTKFTNLGKLPNHWTDREQIWHMYPDSSGNELRPNKINSSRHQGHWGEVRGSQIQKCQRCHTTGPIWTKFGTRVQIHLEMDLG